MTTEKNFKRQSSKH